MATKCFLIEKTGNTRRIACSCGDPDCKVTHEQIEWRRKDSGATLWGYPAEFGPGAMWFEEANAYWWGEQDKAPHLIVVTPGGQWDIDSRASNCTRKQDNVHRCWIRHGEPPNVTVNKNGNTCNAGAGSIQAGSYHGFLVNGALT